MTQHTRVGAEAVLLSKESIGVRVFAAHRMEN